MSIPKVIYVIHANDADLHLGNLKAILGDLQNEERITGYELLGHIDQEAGALQNVGSKDMVINMLSNGMVAERSGLTKVLHGLKERLPECKVGEIIIDNIPYEPEFIAFPTDLMPIRSRENMDAVWNELAVYFRDLFPKPEMKPIPDNVPEKKSSLRQFLEKPYQMFWISVPVILMLGLATAATFTAIDRTLSSDVVTITKIIAVIFIAIGVVYWAMRKFGRQVSVKLNVIHILLTLGGSILILMISLLYNDSDNEIGVIFIIILLGQLIFPINVIYGLTRKRTRNLAG